MGRGLYRSGNPSNPSSTETVALTSSSLDSPKFSLTSGGSALTSVSIRSSGNSVSSFYGDPKAGTRTITAASSGAFSSTVTQTETVNAAAASKLVFTSSALSLTATSNPTAGPITVQSQDSFGNPSNPSSTETVALTSSSPDSPKFSLTSGGSTLTSVSIPSSGNSVSFFYGDTKAGTPTITATGSGAFKIGRAQSKARNEISASDVAFTNSALSLTATSNPTAGPITVQSQDSFGNPSNPSSTETVALTSSSADSPTFSLTSGGSTLTSVSIPSSANSVSFFYGDTKAGTPTITATGSGAFSSTATQTETVNTGAPDHLILSPTTSSLTFGPSPTSTPTGQHPLNS